MKHVREVMRTGLITCTPETTLGEAAALLQRHRIHALVVAQPGREPLGILSDLDMLAGEWLSTDPESLEAMRRITAGEMMTKPPLTIEADAFVADAIERMKTYQVHRLLVTEREKIVGVVSVGDIVLALARQSTTRRTVADVMSRGIVVCRQSTQLHQAARAMTERRSRSIVVVDPFGEPRGIITGWDLLMAMHGQDDSADEKTVSEIMRPPLTIRPGASLREAADMMISNHVHRLLVVDPSQPETFPLGLISTSDIVAEMADPASVWQAQR
jgi:CBS domain-containing protein